VAEVDLEADSHPALHRRYGVGRIPGNGIDVGRIPEIAERHRRCAQNGLQTLQVVVGGGDVGEELEGLQVTVEIGFVVGDQVGGRAEQLSTALEEDRGVAPG